MNKKSVTVINCLVTRRIATINCFGSPLVAAEMEGVNSVEVDRDGMGGCGIWAFGDAETVHSGHTEPSIVAGRRFGVEE